MHITENTKPVTDLEQDMKGKETKDQKNNVNQNFVGYPHMKSKYVKNRKSHGNHPQ